MKFWVNFDEILSKFWWDFKVILGEVLKVGKNFSLEEILIL